MDKSIHVLLNKGGWRARALNRLHDAHNFFSVGLKVSIDSLSSADHDDIEHIENLAINAFDFWPDGSGDPWSKSYELCQTALSRYQQIGDQIGVARILRIMAHHQPDQTSELLRESLEICRAHNDRRGIAETEFIIGKKSTNPAEREEFLRRALTQAREIGESSLVAQILTAMGTLLELNPEESDRVFSEALAIEREAGPSATLVQLLLTSVMFAFRSDAATQREILIEALSNSCDIGSSRFAGLCLHQLSQLQSRSGQESEAGSSVTNVFMK